MRGAVTLTRPWCGTYDQALFTTQGARAHFVEHTVNTPLPGHLETMTATIEIPENISPPPSPAAKWNGRWRVPQRGSAPQLTVASGGGTARPPAVERQTGGGTAEVVEPWPRPRAREGLRQKKVFHGAPPLFPVL
jgi:hypothetical protein